MGLIATPPDHPAQIVERLNDALPDLLSRADASVCWEVAAGWGAVTPRRDGGLVVPAEVAARDHQNIVAGTNVHDLEYLRSK